MIASRAFRPAVRRAAALQSPSALLSSLSSLSLPSLSSSSQMSRRMFGSAKKPHPLGPEYGDDLWEYVDAKLPSYPQPNGPNISEYPVEADPDSIVAIHNGYILVNDDAAMHVHKNKFVEGASHYRDQIQDSWNGDGKFNATDYARILIGFGGFIMLSYYVLLGELEMNDEVRGTPYTYFPAAFPTKDMQNFVFDRATLMNDKGDIDLTTSEKLELTKLTRFLKARDPQSDEEIAALLELYDAKVAAEVDAVTGRAIQNKGRKLEGY